MMTRAERMFWIMLTILFAVTWWNEMGRRIIAESRLTWTYQELTNRHYETTGVYKNWMDDRSKVAPKDFWERIAEEAKK